MSARSRGRWGFVLVAGALLLALLLVTWRLLLTNRVLATGDAFSYFMPYRAFANQALAEGRLPLWNPFLFLGAPFLANPQSAVLYPLHWPFVFLSPARSLIASAGLHLWLAGLGMALYARRAARLSWIASLASGLVLMLSGFLGAHVGQINQLSAVAWLPWLFWLLEEGWGRERAAVAGAGRVNWIAVAALAVVVALQLLAGHTQAAYINLVGLSLAAIWPALTSLLIWLGARIARRPEPMDRAGLRAGLARVGLLAVAVILGAGAAAVQLAPTWELAGYSFRSGGLPYREAVSFSLKPRQLLLTLLPSFGENLPDRFGTPAYAEFVAYVGAAGLALALLGLASARRMTRGNLLRSPQGLATGLALVGLGLALGLYNPLYYLLYRLAPGFDLFRAPARWMALYTVGVAMLAGAGVQYWILARSTRSAVPALRRPKFSRWQWLGIALAIAVGGALLVLQSWPGAPTLLAWIVFAAAVVLLGAIGGRGQWRALAVIGVLVAELALASLALEHTRPSAPEAVTSLRTAPAHLLAAARQAEASGAIPGRFLSISGITFDPGDLAETEAIYRDQLPQQAIYDLVVAQKLQEIIAPNLPLLWQIPAVDAYDGGVLPTSRYVDIQALVAGRAGLDPDGRLREQLTAVPSSRLLRLLGAEFVVTDKGFDLWRDGVYYDLELTTLLEPGQSVTLADTDRLEATEIAVFTNLQGAASLADGETVGEVLVVGEDGLELHFPLRAGIETAEGAWTTAASHTQPAAAQPWPRDQGGWDYLARWPLPQPLSPASIVVRNTGDAGALALRGISLIDDRTGAHAALTVPADGAFRREHSGDVKIYRALDSLPRAYLVQQARVVDSDEAALAALADPTFEPGEAAVLLRTELEAAGLEKAVAQLAGTGEVAVQRYSPEEVVLKTDLSGTSLLVLADSWYPGWQVTVDGAPATLLRADHLFRAVVLPEGAQQVVFRFQPQSLRSGAMISALALAGMVALALADLMARRRRTRSAAL